MAQARTDAVRGELTQNAANGRIRAVAIASAIRDLGGFPDVIGPLLGRAGAAVKALTEQAQPFSEALLGDLALEGQLLGSRYIKALAVAAKDSDIEELATRLVTAHSATVEWITTVLAEDSLDRPHYAAHHCRRAAAGSVVKLVNLPVNWSTRGVDRAVEAVRSTAPALNDLFSRSAHAGEVAAKAAMTARDAALQSAEKVIRDEGSAHVADVVHSARSVTGVLSPDELPIDNYEELNQNDAVAAIKELEAPQDIRAMVAYEEANKGRPRVVSAAQTRVAAIAQEVVGIS